MAGKNKLLLVLSFILLALVLASAFSPFLVARGVALWLRYHAGRSGLTITTGEIRAPLFRPVEIRDLRIVRAGVGRDHLQIDAPRVEAAFRLLALFQPSEHSRPLRSLRLEHGRVVLRGRALESASDIDWSGLAALLPEQFDVSADQLLFEQPLGRVEMHDARISGNTARSGEVTVASFQLRGPYFQKTFADIHGVTRWQDSRLIIGSLHLLDGLEIDSFAIDLTRLHSSRIAAELSMKVFSGNMRANFATEGNGKTRLWEAAGSASGISLSQLGPALGMTELLTGSLRASKFSFRGDPRDILHATASLWTELTGFSWRERKADVIMVGANFYERTVQLQELYIKQRNNELTLSGETALSADWLNPDFRGDISGAINDLGQFAELFGAAADTFGGKVAVRGRVHAHEHKVDGDVALTGDALKVFRNPVDSLTARFTLDSPHVHLDQFEIKRGEDFVHARGQVDFVQQRKFALSAESSCRDARDYQIEVPLLGSLSGSLLTHLDAKGDENAATISFSAQTPAQTPAQKFSAHGVLRGGLVALDNLTVAMNDATAAFTGTLTVAEPRKLSVSPLSDVRLAQPLDDKVCVRGLDLRQGDFGSPLSRIVLTEDQIALTDPVSTTHKLSVCPEEQSAAQPLQLSLPASTPSPTPTASPAPATPPPSPKPETNPSPQPSAKASAAIFPRAPA
jgi:hypothetical protein